MGINYKHRKANRTACFWWPEKNDNQPILSLASISSIQNELLLENKMPHIKNVLQSWRHRVLRLKKKENKMWKTAE